MRIMRVYYPIDFVSHPSVSGKQVWEANCPKPQDDAILRFIDWPRDRHADVLITWLIPDD